MSVPLELFQSGAGNLYDQRSVSVLWTVVQHRKFLKRIEEIYNKERISQLNSHFLKFCPENSVVALKSLVDTDVDVSQLRHEKVEAEDITVDSLDMEEFDILSQTL